MIHGSSKVEYNLLFYDLNIFIRLSKTKKLYPYCLCDVNVVVYKKEILCWKVVSCAFNGNLKILS